MIVKFDKWKNILSHCTNEAECKVDEVKKDYDANKTMFESLMIGNYFSKTLDHFVGSKVRNIRLIIELNIISDAGKFGFLEKGLGRINRKSGECNQRRVPVQKRAVL